MATRPVHDYDKIFMDAHHAGAERHGTLWLTANEFLVLKARRLDFDASTKANRALLSVVALSVLDTAKRFYESEGE